MTCGMTVAPRMPDGEQDALGAAKPGRQSRLRPLTPDRARRRTTSKRERDDDHADERRDDGLEPAEAARCRARIAKATTPAISAGRKERDAEQQVEPERRADELGEVGRHRDHLGLQPEPDRRGLAGSARGSTSGRFLPVAIPSFAAQRLHEHRHQVRGEHDPEQQVAELRAGGDVGREVARIDVGDRGDERRPEERPEAADAVACALERLLGGDEDASFAGKDVVERVLGRVPVVGRASRGSECGAVVRRPVSHVDTVAMRVEASIRQPIRWLDYMKGATAPIVIEAWVLLTSASHA